MCRDSTRRSCPRCRRSRCSSGCTRQLGDGVLGETGVGAGGAGLGALKAGLDAGAQLLLVDPPEVLGYVSSICAATLMGLLLGSRRWLGSDGVENCRAERRVPKTRGPDTAQMQGTASTVLGADLIADAL